MFLSPAMVNTMKRDAVDLLNGLDGSDCILHWQTGTGTPDNYGRYPSSVDHTSTVRCHFSWTETLDHAIKNAEKAGATDVQLADAILYFDAAVNLNVMGIWFEIQNVGSFSPGAKPPTGANSRPATLIGGEVLLQEIYCKMKR